MNEVKNFFEVEVSTVSRFNNSSACIIWIKSMINLILITFILTFLMDRFQCFISKN